MSDIVQGWGSAAEVAGRSVASLRNLIERGRLVATKEDGVYIFQRADLEALPGVVAQSAAALPGAGAETSVVEHPASNDAPDEDVHGRAEGNEKSTSDDRDVEVITRGEPAGAGSPGVLDGELASRLFSAFAAGKTPVDVVVELKLSPAVVAAVHADWTRLGGEVKPAANIEQRLAAIERRSDGIASAVDGTGRCVSEGMAARARRDAAMVGRISALERRPEPWSYDPLARAQVAAVAARVEAIERTLSNWTAAWQADAMRRARTAR